MDAARRDRFRAAVAASHRGLEAMLDEHADGLDMAAPSLLPNWTIGHVLSHLARNVDSMTRALGAAERGEVVDRYPGGAIGRDVDIEAGAGRPAAEQLADSRDADVRLDAAFVAHTRWDGHYRELSGRVVPVEQLVLLRWREVEVHRHDLGLGYQPEDWPPEYSRVELNELTMRWNAWRPMGLTGLPPEALAAPERQRLAWLLGRAEIAGLDPAGVL